MNQLRFGDFTGLGRTDALAVVGGRWAISEPGAKSWRTLNQNLGDPVDDLYIANMDADDNIGDILRLERKFSVSWDYPNKEHWEFIWWRSKNGVEPWKVWKTCAFDYDKRDLKHWRPYSGSRGA